MITKLKNVFYKILFINYIAVLLKWISNIYVLMKTINHYY
jgi:hypothetical protein